MEAKKQEAYHSFLLRLWQVKADTGQEWRATLENVESGEKHGFTSVEGLLVFICKLTEKRDEISGKEN